jgi:hypothetical protein
MLAAKVHSSVTVRGTGRNSRYSTKKPDTLAELARCNSRCLSSETSSTTEFQNLCDNEGNCIVHSMEVVSHVMAIRINSM